MSSSELSHLIVALVSFGIGVVVTWYHHYGRKKSRHDLGFRKY